MQNEEIIQQAKLFTTRGAWLKAHPATYLLAKRRGVFVEAVAHMPQARRCTKEHGARQLERKYSEDELRQSALKFNRRSDWALGDPRLYRAAQAQKLLDTLCAHMVKVGSVRSTRSDLGGSMPNRREYTDEDIRESAKQFSTRKEWREAFPGHYRSAQARGILDDVAGHQFLADPVNHWRAYAYEFPDNSAYIGVTSNSLHIRHLSHCYRGTVRRRSRQLGLDELPLPKLLQDGCPRNDVKAMEDRWINEYRSAGFAVVNKKKGGDLGPCNRVSASNVDWTQFGHNLKAVILTGAPGSGKSWVFERLDGVYKICVDEIPSGSLSSELAKASKQDLLILLDPTVRAGTIPRIYPRMEFTLVVITEPPEVVKKRITERGGDFSSTVQRRVRRAYRMAKKAAFSGSSDEVLAWLKLHVSETTPP